MDFETAKKTNDKDYRVFLYNKDKDGNVISKKVNITDAINLGNAGWAMSPAEFVDDEDLKDNPRFKILCEEVSRDRNIVENIDLIEDKSEIEQVLERMFGVKVRSDMKIENMKKRVIKEAKAKGIIE